MNKHIYFSCQNNSIKPKILALKCENNEKCYNCDDPDFCNGKHRGSTWKCSLFEFEIGKFQKLSISSGMGKGVTAQVYSKVIIYGWPWSCNSTVLEKMLRKKVDIQCICHTHI